MSKKEEMAIRRSSMVCSDDTGRNYCLCCGSSWKTRRRWLYWPISFGMQPKLLHGQKFNKVVAVWGWQVGADRMSQPIFGWTFRIWRFLIKFGSMNPKKKCRYDSRYGTWIDNRLKEKTNANAP